MLLEGKRGVIFGLANHRSLAFSIARACQAQGARLAVAYQNERLKDHMEKLLPELPGALALQCDLNHDEEIIGVAKRLEEEWGQVDFVAHCVAYAVRDDLMGRFVETSREGFKIALETSAYTLVAACRALDPILSDSASILTLSYLGGERVAPNYNVMGVAKAALEASVRYLAWDFGPRGIRVNALSPGPVQTLAARGVRDFNSMLEHVRSKSAMKRDTDPEEVASAAVFLFSDLGRGITGETIYVDAGYSIMAL
ncbi:MAG: enoyl-ACP reductase [Armatimonadetes bacterium]|nr:enoyl-ACP reductase [Armatimonadota bacterium]